MCIPGARTGPLKPSIESNRLHSSYPLLILFLSSSYLLPAVVQFRAVPVSHFRLSGMQIELVPTFTRKLSTISLSRIYLVLATLQVEAHSTLAWHY